MSTISENSLRKLLRSIILEIENNVDKEEDKDILGEPDLSSEDERDNPSHDVDEINAIGGSTGGSITGHQGQGKQRLHREYDPENPKYKKRNKKSWK